MDNKSNATFTSPLVECLNSDHLVNQLLIIVITLQFGMDNKSNAAFATLLVEHFTPGMHILRETLNYLFNLMMYLEIFQIRSFSDHS